MPSSFPHADSISLRQRLWPDWYAGHEPNVSLWSLWEQVRQEFPEHFLGIDCFPARVPENERYAQLEVSYNPERPSARYETIEKRFLEVLELLWVYGPTYAETQRPHEASLEGLAPPMRAVIERLLGRSKEEPLPLVPLDGLDEFRDLAVLGLRGIVPSVFVFTEYDMVLWQNEVSFSQVYLGNLSYKGMLQSICTTSGLYLRG